MAWKSKKDRAKERQNRPLWKITPLQEIAARNEVWQILKDRYPSAAPTKAEWDEFRRKGWTSDGATAARDSVCGVNIGSKGDEAAFWPPKPATLHDYMFQKGGGRGKFRLANVIFRDYLFLYIMKLRNPRVYPEGRVKRAVSLYYWGVRTRLAFGFFNFIPEKLIGRKII